MNPQGGDLLSQLRDIHGAPDAPWWPPAPGWWLLAVVLLLALFFLIRHALNRYHVRKRRLKLTRFIDQVESGVNPETAPQEFLSSLNRVFKIVAMRAFPDSHCALLQGDDWVSFVRAQLTGEDDDGELAVLAQGPYQPVPEFDAGSLTRLARQWVARYG